ncbi:tetratricopeptide repeat protein [Streptomyces paradoxus]|uniref:Tetratricopeptide repeat protein n=1 Tax=Streptomyces paradoxus TaxID=66375 RepID=A0A7W9THT3_9ACTN|nr:tetratricopeptide repeat protein [Streptomyces paradoxus]MBB6080985.1 hypothetical protein [Streptomyces paradoxus]
MTWPHLVGVLPRQANHFQDRGAAAQLEQATIEGGTAVLGQVLAGMGGVGKTQLAAHHARTLWQAGQLDLLMWITASTRPAVVSGYAEAAAAILDADPADPDRAARAFLAWLEPGPATGLRWMVVLDDLADPADLRGLWPPTSPHGRTLITTRRRDRILQGDGRRLVRVGLFTEQEAAAYLTATLAAHDRHEPADQLTGLAADLGHLPLALSQAAAYLIDVDLNCATYRRLLTDRARTLADVLPDGSGLPDDQATTAAAAWSLSVDRADQLPPVGLARPMLQLTSILNPNGIPASVLTSVPTLTYLAERATRPANPADAGRAAVGPAPQSATPTAEDALGALRALRRLSLIDHTPATAHQAVRIHQLIQRTTCDALTPAELDQLARTAADALVSAWPEVERDTALAQALRANTDALRAHVEDALYRPDVHAVLQHAGNSLGDSGQVTAALNYFQHLATSTCHRLGPDHPSTLTTRHNLAFWRGEAGDVAGAAIAFAELLDDRVRVLGEDHPDALATRHSLAFWRGRAGDVAGAAAALTELLDDRVRVLGEDHPDTLATRHSLAFCRGEAGDVAGAAAALTELLDDRVRVLGEDHPDTLTTRHELAFWRGEAGDAVVDESNDSCKRSASYGLRSGIPAARNTG